MFMFMFVFVCAYVCVCTRALLCYKYMEILSTQEGMTNNITYHVLKEVHDLLGKTISTPNSIRRFQRRARTVFLSMQA